MTDMESRGIPGVFVASREFASAIDAQARALGADVSFVLVAHPIQDRTDEEMRRLAEASIDEVAASLTMAG